MKNIFGYFLFTAMLLTAIATKSFALPESFESEFNDAASEQTRDYYMLNPAALNPGIKQQRSGIEKNRLNSKSEGIGGLTPGRQSHGVNIFSPMSGFTDTMMSKEYANQLGKILSGPMTLYLTTMQLTEPAVASGVNNAAQQSYSALITRYLAEDLFRKQLESNPESRQIMLPAYDACIANEIRLRADKDSEEVLDDKATWIEAQSKCMGDRSDSIAAISGAQQFDKLSDGSATARGFNFFMDPSHPQWQGVEGEENSILLTDYIFNQSNYEEVGLDLNSLRAAFEGLLGNYQFFVEKETSNGTRSASRELSFKRLPPTKNRSELLLEAEEDNYNKIANLVEMRCKHNQEAAAAAAPEEGKESSPVSADAGAFCVKNSAVLGEMFVDLSFVGFEFDCNMVEELFLTFTFENKRMQNHGGSSSASGSIDCSIIKSKEYQQLKDKGQFSKSAHSNMVYLAGEITLGQIYLIVLNIQQVIENLTVSNKQFVRNFAYQLLNDFAGTGSIYDRYSSIIRNIEIFKSRLAEDIVRKRKQNNAA